LEGGFSNRTLQYADVSSMTRTCDADSVMIHMIHRLCIINAITIKFK